MCGLWLAVLGPEAAHAQAQHAQAQHGGAVLSALGRLSVRGVSLDDARVPLSTRVAQARNLGHLGDPELAVTVLIEVLSKRPPRALFEAVVASLAERRSARAVPELLRVLRARPVDPALVCRALTAIGGPQVIDAFAGLAAAGDRQVKFHALRSLAVLSPERAGPLLLVALSSADEVVRRVALQIAIDVPRTSWLAPLANALRQSAEQPEVIELAWALSRIPQGAGLPALMEAARVQPQPMFHLAVAIAVCLRAFPEAHEPTSRARAVAMLERVQPTSQRAVIQQFLGAERASVASPEAVSQKRAVALRRALRGREGQSVPERVAAVGPLSRSGDPKAWVPLLAALVDPEPAVRRETIRWLSFSDALEVRDALRRRAALETDPEVAALAQWAAGADPRAFDDPWGAGRALLSVAVDREVAPLAR